MEMQRGLVVCCTAGREKGSYLAVVQWDGGWPLLADGRERRLAKPKKKNPRHLRATATVLPEAALTTDNQLHKALREAGFSPVPGAGPKGGVALG